MCMHGVPSSIMVNLHAPMATYDIMNFYYYTFIIVKYVYVIVHLIINKQDKCH